MVLKDIVHLFRSKERGSIVPIFDELLTYLKSQYELTYSKSEYVFISIYETPFNDGTRIRDYHWSKLRSLTRRCTYYLNWRVTLQMYAKYRKREDVKKASFLGNI